MQGHHLILGTLTDFITGEILPETHDERYRQNIARLLVETKGYDRKDIRPRHELKVKAGEKCAVIKVDFLILVDEKNAMMIRYGPGSLVTRHRSALAMSRLIESSQIPVVVVTNGEDADILDGFTGDILDSGLETIPSKPDLTQLIAEKKFKKIEPYRAEMESRIVYAFEVDGACPCDETICQLPNEDVTS